MSFFVVVIYLPAHSVYWAYRNFHGTSLTPDERLKIEQSHFFEGVSLRNFGTMIFTAIFMIRRTLTILLIFFVKSTNFQLMGIVYMSIFYAMYLVHFRPVADISNNIWNEITILVVSYCMMVLGDISIKFEGRKFLGITILAVISLNVVYNVSRAAISTMRELFLSFKEFIKKKPLNEQFKEDIARVS